MNLSKTQRAYRSLLNHYSTASAQLAKLEASRRRFSETTSVTEIDVEIEKWEARHSEFQTRLYGILDRAAKGEDSDVAGK